MAKTVMARTTTKAESKLRKRKADDPEQYKCFREFAREVEVDESDEAFERIFKRIVISRNNPS
jgi:hypothetical protein